MTETDYQTEKKFAAVMRRHFFLQGRRHDFEEAIRAESVARADIREDIGVHSVYGPRTLGAAYRELRQEGAEIPGE